MIEILLVLALMAGPAAQAGASGSVAGVVVTGSDARPVRLAVVTLAGPTLPRPRLVVTDDAGRFAFDGIPAGRYTLTADKAAHITGAFGAKRPGRPGTPLTVGPGEQVRDLRIDLPRGAVISGIVRDEYGQPAPGITVGVLRANVLGTSGIMVRPEGVITDDRGVYRLFGIAPGEYVVVAMARVSGVGEMGAMSAAQIDAALRELQAGRTTRAPEDAARAASALERYGFASIFFPSTADADQATRLKLDAGDERHDIDITLRFVPTATIRGTVTSLDGGSLKSVRVSLARDGPMVNLPGGLEPGGGTVDAEGRFEITSVAPGRYRLIARTFSTPGSTDTLWATANVVVDGNDITGIALPLRPGLHVSGRIVFDGDTTAAPPPEQLRVRLTQEALPSRIAIVITNTTGFTLPTVGGPVRADGSFDLTGVLPGRYRIAVTPASPMPDWHLQSAIVSGRDALDYGVEIGEQDVTGAVLTFSNRHTGLTGVLQTPAGAPAADYFVIVFPVDRTMWRPRARRVQAVRPDTSGQFVFRDLPAGDYRIAALTDVAPDEWNDPALLAALLPASVPLTLKPGENTRQDLRIAR